MRIGIFQPILVVVAFAILGGRTSSATEETLKEAAEFRRLADGENVMVTLGTEVTILRVSPLHPWNHGRRAPEIYAPTEVFHLFPHYFSDLLNKVDPPVWPLDSVVLSACSGHWADEWGRNNDSHGCWGQSLSACTTRPADGDPQMEVEDTASLRGIVSNSSCPTWRRLTTILGTTFGTTFGLLQADPCPHPHDALSTHKPSSWHQRHVCIRSGDADDSSGKGRLTTPQSCYFGVSPTEPFCVEHLAPLLGMLPSQRRYRVGEPRQESVQALPRGVWDAFLPDYQTVFGSKYHRLQVDIHSKRIVLNQRQNAGTEVHLAEELTLKVALTFVKPVQDILEYMKAGWYPAAGGKAAAAVQKALLNEPAALAAPSALNSTVTFYGFGEGTNPEGVRLDLQSQSRSELQRLCIEILTKGLPFIQRHSLEWYLKKLEQHRLPEASEGLGVAALLGTTDTGRVLKISYLERNGEIDGLLNVLLNFSAVAISGSTVALPSPRSSSIDLLVTIPVHVIRPRLYSAKVQLPQESSGCRAELFLLKLTEDAWNNLYKVLYRVTVHYGEAIHPQAQARAHLPAVLWSLEYDIPFLNIRHYPPDANRPYWIPAPIVRYEGRDDRCPRDAHPHELALAGQFPPVGGSHVFCFESAAEPLVLSLPVPDVAMPFNVLALSCAVYAAVFGLIYSLAVRGRL